MGDRNSATGRPASSSAAPAAAPTTARDTTLVLLALAAGTVDAISYLGLGQVLTAAMTGNTVLLGIALGQADLEAALRASIALAGFFAGVLLGASILVRKLGLIWSWATVAALALELALLVGLGGVWALSEDISAFDHRYPLIAAAGGAMGIQSAVAYSIAVPGIATTYVTGTLTTLATRLVRQSAGRGSDPHRVDTAMSSWLPAAIWLAYGFGAVCAGATRLWWSSADPGFTGEVRWPQAALALPVVMLTAATLVVLVHRWRRAGRG